MVYRVLVEKDDSEPGRCAYSAFVPDVPNCYTCAESWEELERMVREVVEACIEVQGEAGRAYPAPTGFVFQVSVPA